MANSVVRYLVEKNEIPVYRVFVMGMGNAKVAVSDGTANHARGNRVEVSLLKNNVDQLASAGQPEAMGGMQTQNGYSNQASSPMRRSGGFANA